LETFERTRGSGGNDRPDLKTAVDVLRARTTTPNDAFNAEGGRTYRHVRSVPWTTAPTDSERLV
jgi:hypothetical protein